MEHNKVVVIMIRLDLQTPFSMRLQPDQSEHPSRGTQSNASLCRKDKPGLCAGERGAPAPQELWNLVFPRGDYMAACVHRRLPALKGNP